MGLVAVDQLVGLHLGHVEHGEGVGVGVDVQHSHVALRHLTMHWMEKGSEIGNIGDLPNLKIPNIVTHSSGKIVFPIIIEDSFLTCLKIKRHIIFSSFSY